MIDRLLETDTVVRAVRTFAQAFLAALVAALPASAVLQLEVYATAAAGAVYAALVAVLSFLQNELEDAGRIKDRR